jgi:DNA polymerase-1
MSRTALIDADLVCYMACMGEGGSDHVVRMTHDEDATPLTADAVTRAIDTVDLRIADWQQFVGAEEVVLAFTDEGNFRKKLSPFYKATRSEKPEIYEEVERTIRMNYTSVSYPGLEGDDVLGILQTAHRGEGSTVVISGDKDIKTIPGHIYHVPHWTRIKKGDFGKVTYNPELEADRFWMTQTLMGDTTDGYSGCPGVGPKRAKEILKRCQSLSDMWDAVVTEYASKKEHKTWGKKFVHGGNPLNEALINARCARILRNGDYNTETEEVYLWRP